MYPWMALTGIYIRRTGPLLCGNVALILLGTWLVTQVLSPTVEWAATEGQPLGRFFNFVTGVVVLVGMTAWAYTIESFRGTGLATLPVSSRMLGTIRWLVPGVVVFLFSLIAMSGLTWLLDADWPVLTTATGITVFSMLAGAVVCRLEDFSFARLLGGVVATGLLGLWFMSRFYPEGFSNPAAKWRVFSAFDHMVIWTSVAASRYMHVAAWTTRRSGSHHIPWLFTMTEEELYGILQRGPQHRTLPTMTSLVALRKMEWALAHSVAVGSGLLLGLFGLVAGTFALVNDRTPAALIGIVPSVAGVCGILVAQLVAQDWTLFQQAVGIRPFLSAMPFSDRQLAHTMLRTLARAVLVSVGIATCGLLVVPVVYGLLTDFDRFAAVWHSPEFEIDRWLAGAVLATAATWAATGLTAALVLTGRPWIMVSVLVAVSFGPIGLLLSWQFAGDFGQQLLSTCGLVLEIIAVVAVVLLFCRAQQLRLISMQSLIVSLFVVAITVAALWQWEESSMSLSTAALIGSLATLPVVPFALVPLTIRWCRHQ